MAITAGCSLLLVEWVCSLRARIRWSCIDPAAVVDYSQRTAFVPTGNLLAVAVFLNAHGVHPLVKCKLGAHMAFVFTDVTTVRGRAFWSA